ncbi:hypothetical protein IC582_006109 [Cucumis melo]
MISMPSLKVKTIWKIGSRKRENTMDHQSKNAWMARCISDHHLDRS